MSEVRAAAAGHEIELKLAAAARDLPRIARHPAVLALAAGPAQRARLRSVYYDTPAFGLWRSGLVLRVRADGRRRSVGVKTRGAARAGLVVREEHEQALGAAASDPRRVSARALLAAIGDRRLRRAVERAAAGQRLGARLETDFRRTTLPLRTGGAQIELALDHGEVRAGRARFPIAELELELQAGAAHALFAVALDLARDFELHPEPVGKAERGFLRLLDDVPAPSRAEPVPLAADASLEEAVRAVAGECVRHLTANQRAAERGDPEGVHQMRVASRRLRSALRLFEPWLPARTLDALVGELRWLGEALGRARDLDVFALELLAPLAARRAGDTGLAALRDAATDARHEDYTVVRAALASRRYTTLVLQLGRLAEAPPLRRSARGATARAALRPLLRRRAARMVALGRRIEELSAPELHRLRIRAKRMRYTLELVGPLVDGRRSLRSARRLAELQDALGRLNDLTNAEAQLAALRARLPAEPSEAVARAEGFVLGYAARSTAAGREALAGVWRRAAGLDPLRRSPR